MARVGYRRVSSEGQNWDRQELADCDKVFEEKLSGANRDRPALRSMIDWVREGDEVIIHSLDRLARDLRDLQSIVQKITGTGCSVSFMTERLTFRPGDEDPYAQLQLQLMGAFAQFERSIIRQRQREGIARAKARGAYKGRRPTIDVAKVRKLASEGSGATEIARSLGISRASVYRVLQDFVPKDEAPSISSV